MEEPQSIIGDLRTRLLFFAKRLTRREKYFCLAFGVVCLYAVYVFFHLPPNDFPVGHIITISSGESLQTITSQLYNEHVIRSPFVFQATVILLGGERRLIAGDYLLDQPEGPADIASRLVNGKFHLVLVKLTIPEGWNSFQIKTYLGTKLPDLNVSEFLTLAKSNEGYLFPDTYFVSFYSTPQELVQMMEENFSKKIATLQKKILASGHSEKEVVTMASILEGEALPADRQIVAGILWKRLSLGIPLQVDAPFTYITGKNTFDLSPSDLKINSPYNTYLHTGLPPTPISNPGLNSLLSAVTPISTDYLYFLTTPDGTIHYAKTFAEHEANIQKYLK